MATTTTIWDAHRILNVNPNAIDFTCVGNTKKNCRCLNRINEANRNAASRLLNDIAATTPQRTRPLEGLLEELAPMVLCQRNHQDQAAKVVRGWLCEVSRLRSGPTRSPRTTMESPHTTRESPRPTRASNPRFDPYSALSIAPDSRGFSCVGHSYSEGGPCNRPITSRTDRIIACAILDKIATGSFSARSLESLLERLAPLVLCGRHQRQSDRTIMLWLEILDHLAVEGSRRASVLPRVRRAVERSEYSISNRSDDDSDTPSESHPSDSDSDSDSESDSDALSTISTAATSTTSIPPPAPTPPQTMPTPTRHTRVTRRPLESSCSICLCAWEPSEEIVWCKRQCGQSFHKICMDEWAENKRSNEGTPDCPYCRAEWEDQVAAVVVVSVEVVSGEE